MSAEAPAADTPNVDKRAAPTDDDKDFSWKKRGKHDMYELSRGEFIPGRPIAAFDFDSTLVPCRGRGPLADDSAKTLVRIALSGFNIVVISNRSSSESPEDAHGSFKSYAKKLAKAAPSTKEASIQMYALYSSECRKPHTMSWETILDQCGPDGLPAGSFFCGDAAGRDGDFASSDLDFAANCGVQFVTAEVVFALDNASSVRGALLPWPDASPASAARWGMKPAADYSPDTIAALRLDAADEEEKKDSDVDAAELAAPTAASIRAGLGLPPKAPVCYIMMGSPGSGKSKWANAQESPQPLAGVPDVNPPTKVFSADTMGSAWAVHARNALKSGQSVVIDNTHGTAESRKATKDMAEAAKATPVLVHMTTSKELCVHLNEARRALGRKAVPLIAINTYWKRQEAPDAQKEGMQVVAVPFALDRDSPPQVATHRYRLKGR
jgi:DNA 3'-phosphatase